MDRQPEIHITINGERHVIRGEPVHRSLLSWLRSQGLTGTKEGCAEGDCGACTVAVVERDAAGRPTFRAINACLALLPALAGREVWTVEGLAKTPPGGHLPRLEDLHPVQRAMVEKYGSQCGYCTPGFVMSMFEGHYRTDLGEGDERLRKLGEQLHGNLCRCTGYRPIRDAMVAAEEMRREPESDLFQLRLAKDVSALAALEYSATDHAGRAEKFFRPTTLADLCDLLAEHPEAELLAGATEIGVEINKKARAFPTLISTDGVAELSRVWRDDAGWHVGGAATLTQVEEALAGELPAVDKMLRVFASRQIRHRATLAGNIVTASPIGDTPPLLLALDAEIVLAKSAGRGKPPTKRRVPIDGFFTGYRKTLRARDEVVVEIVWPHAPAGVRRRFDSYKVSKRRELDISIVACAFAVDEKAGVVTRARLAYGGVAATPVRAKKAEAALIGRRLDEETLAAVLPILETEATPIGDVRSGKDFRRGLIASLFEKFVRGEQSEGLDAPLIFRVGDGDGDRDGVGVGLRHESGVGHVTGAAQYVDDEAQKRGGTLVLWPVTSPHAHARIKSRDASEAAKMPGVACVLMAEDVPGDNDVGAIRHDETLFAKDEALFFGHIVAVVVGDSYEACRAAAAKVRVEYEPLEAILSIEDAIANSSFHTDPHRIARGDAAGAMASAPHTLSGELHIGGQEHFYLESQAAWAECGDDGDLHVTSSTQHPSEIQATVSHVLALPRNRVVVTAPRMGGGFGGKETQGNTWAALVALAAYKTRRPVRVQLDRDVDMTLTGKRHPFLARWEIGFDDDGKLLAWKAELVSDGGWSADLSESICDRALFHIDNSYFVPNVDVTGRVAKTHHVSHTAFRGFGGPQGMVVIEDAIDRVARQLGLLPEVVRARNFYRDGHETHYGQRIEHCRLERIWGRLSESSELARRRQAIAEFNARHEDKKRGIAMTPVKFGISFTASFLNQAGALVLLYRDGTAQINHGGTEMGQGLYTKMRGVAMRELGLPAEAVRVMKTRTDKVPNTSATAASSGADLNGAAVKNACDALRTRLAPLAAKLLAERSSRSVQSADISFANGLVFARSAPSDSVTFAELCERAHVEQISLAATGFYRTPGIAYDRAKGRGTPFYYFAYGAAVSEVEVDARSGMKRVLRVDILHDVGDTLNTGVDRGQVEGAFVQGMGWLTSEELKWSDKGALGTHSASTYQIPAIGDAPADFRVELLEDAAQPGTIHGSKAVGEPPLMLAISVREALRDAVAAFGAPGGVVELPAPATHEAIYLTIQRRLRERPGHGEGGGRVSGEVATPSSRVPLERAAVDAAEE
ncbi:MAG TPA: xanthine dehydrogenase molybdopterin binding subunit [Polyangiaceae bacterium]|nr:xanthine dehydrogenase molybdopterin binding subunit [Polyangiaceae bacterium]